MSGSPSGTCKEKRNEGGKKLRVRKEGGNEGRREEWKEEGREGLLTLYF